MDTLMKPEDYLTHYSTRVSWARLDHASINRLIERARDEDLEGLGFASAPGRRGDVSSALLDPVARGRARLVARQKMSICGLPLIPMIFEAYGGDCGLKEAVEEGTLLEKGDCLGVLEGAVATMLSCERVILNFLQRLSGIATETHRYVEALGTSRTRLLDTRKTTPGWRALEKYAVATGGGWNHRLGLYDRVMLKDNHLAVGGHTGEALADLVKRAVVTYPDLAVEVEVDAIGQIPPVLEAGAHVVMLDNFSDTELGEALTLIAGRAATEASGGITLERLPRLARLGLDFISTGATIHQAPWVDIGLDWDRMTDA